MLSARERQLLGMIEQQLVLENPRLALRFDKLLKPRRLRKPGRRAGRDRGAESGGPAADG